MTGCLLAAWAIVSLAMIKGIKSSARVREPPPKMKRIKWKAEEGQLNHIKQSEETVKDEIKIKGSQT